MQYRVVGAARGCLAHGLICSVAAAFFAAALLLNDT